MKKFFVSLLVSLALLAAPALAQQSGGPWVSALIGGKTYNAASANIAGACVQVSGTFPAQTIFGGAGVNAQVGTTYTVVAADQCKMVTFTNASPVAVTLPVASTTGFGANWKTIFVNRGTGTVTITPTTSTINGATTLVLTSGQGAEVYSDATNYVANVGAGSGSGITALTGDVTASGSGSVAATIANNAVTNAKAAQMAAHSYKGNNTGSTANAADLTATQLTAELNAMVGDSGSGGTKGLAPAPGAGDAAASKFLSAAGTWAVPSGSGSGNVNGPVSSTAGDIATFADTSGALLSDTPTLGAAHGGTGLATYSAHSIPLATASTTLASKVVPDCTDTGGNHLNFTQSGDTFSCGTSGGSSGSAESHTASSSASLNFTSCIDGSVNNYRFVVSGLVAANSGDSLQMRVMTTGSHTIDTGNNYEWVKQGWTSGNAANNQAGTVVAFTNLANSLGNTAGFAADLDFVWHNLNSTSLRKHYLGTLSYETSNPLFVAASVGGDWLTTGTAVTGITFFMTTGNIASGNISCYRLPN